MMGYTFTGTYVEGLDEWLTHDPREDIKADCYCDECGKGLFEGDPIYKINGHKLCKKCVDDIFMDLV